MNCDLCKRENNTMKLLCDCCGEMIRRLLTIDARMRTREVCEAERLASRAENGIAAAQAGVTARF